MNFAEAEHIRSTHAKRLKDLPDQSFADCPYCLKLNKLPDDNRGLRVCGDCWKIFEVK